MKLAPGWAKWTFLLGILGGLSLPLIPMLSALLWGLMGLILIFYRDPQREIPDSGVVSPADGVVIDLDPSMNWIGIFMRPWDVHVNRAPYSGIVTQIKFVRGRHAPGFLRSAHANTANIIKISTSHGEMELRQIAGMFARRIKCYIREGQRLERGQRIGMICFGSRVELSLPPGFRLSLRKFQKLKAGQTIIATEPVQA